MDQAEHRTDDGEPLSPPVKPLIKRRWAILGRAGGGVAVIAVAGALALSDPTEGSDSGDPGGDDTEISAEA